MAKQGAKTVTPRLRFPEFRGAPSWIEKTLGDEGEFLSPLTGKTAQHFGTGNAKYVTYMNVFANTFTDIATLGVVDVTEGESQNPIEPGDVLFTVSSETPEEVGMSSVVVDAAPNCYVNSFCAMFRFSGGKQPNLRFLGYALRQPFARRHFVKRAQGSTRFNLSKPAFRSLPLALPIAAEQQKIADCLTSLDEVIAAQGRKVEALKAHKRGLMQQLFPREGETRPRLRFPEFRDAPEWKKHRLGDIASISKGKGISKADIAVDGRTPCIRYGELYTVYGEVIDQPLSRTNVPTADLVLSQAGDVIVPASGETKEDIATSSVVLRADIALGGDLNIIRLNVDGRFFSYYLNGAKRRALAKVAQGDTVVHLYPRQLEQLDIAIPVDNEEQQRIADCLASLDTRITAETARLAALKTHKQGLMQQLFPAPDAAGA